MQRTWVALWVVLAGAASAGSASEAVVKAERIVDADHRAWSTTAVGSWHRLFLTEISVARQLAELGANDDVRDYLRKRIRGAWESSSGEYFAERIFVGLVQSGVGPVEVDLVLDLAKKQPLRSRLKENDLRCEEVNLLIAPDGDLHVFALFGSSPKQLRPQYARFSGAGDVKSTWLELTSDPPGEYECYGLPAAALVGADSILTVTPFISNPQKLIVRKIEGGVPKTPRTLVAGKNQQVASSRGTQSRVHVDSPLAVLIDDKKSMLLFLDRDRFAWSKLDSFKVTAVAYEHSTFEFGFSGSIAGALDAKGQYHLAVETQPSKVAYGRGTLGKSLGAKPFQGQPALQGRAFFLGNDPAGSTYLVGEAAPSPAAGSSKVLAFWPVSQSAAPAAVLSPWASLGTTHEVQAAFADGEIAYVAWVSETGIHLRPVTLAGKAK